MPSKHKFELNKEKLAELKKRAQKVRTGGKGAVRRTRKAPRDTRVSAEDTRVMNQMKRYGTQPLGDIEEVSFFLDDDKAKVFTNPKVHHAPGRGLFVISGPSTVKNADEVQSNTGGANAQIAQLLQQLNMGQGAGAPEGSGIPEAESFENVE